MSALELVNLGNVNTGDGDPIRTAFRKLNNNSTLINAIGLGNSNLTFNGNAIISNADIQLQHPAGNLYLGNGFNLNITGAARNGQFLQAGVPAAGTVIWGDGAVGNIYEVQFREQLSNGSPGGFAATNGFSFNPNSNALSVSGIVTSTTMVANVTQTGNLIANGNVSVYGALNVYGSTNIITPTAINTGNLILQLGSNIGNASNAASNALVTGGGIVLGNNITGGNVTMLYNAAANSWQFSRNIQVPIGNGAYANILSSGANIQSTGTIQAQVGVFDVLQVNNVSSLANADASFLYIGNSQPANAFSNAQGILLQLESLANSGQGFVGLQLISNSTSNATSAGQWSIYSEAVTGNLTFNGSNNLPAANRIAFDRGGNIYTKGIYNLSGVPFNGTPGGANATIQFNNAGSFGGSANLVFDRSSNTLTLSGNINVIGDIYNNNALFRASPGGANLALQFNLSNTTAGANSVTFNPVSNTFAVTGNTNLGNIANVTITGGTRNQIIMTNGSNVLSYSNASASYITTVGTATNYTVLPTDFYVGVSGATGNVVITLFQGNSTFNGKTINIKDETGALAIGTRIITIQAQGTDTFEGVVAGNVIMQIPYNSYTIVYRNGGWWIF